uniref:Nucleolar GTP-binding protein 1 n=1 Tax=Oncorhynchus tshawytscha TaxID=74940 RepID=A0A8C8GZN1_ONCTS
FVSNQIKSNVIGHIHMVSSSCLALHAYLLVLPTMTHLFYADLMNVLYDKNHYKLVLGQINIYGISLYRCKQLKRASLGRMCTIMKRQKQSLEYLEQVHQHLSCLQTIDPNTRTLLLCGYPNAGRSSLINKVTRADVEVQPYAFTTKSLFVSHMDYKYLCWQPGGVLDHCPVEKQIFPLSSNQMRWRFAAEVYFVILFQDGTCLSRFPALFHQKIIADLTVEGIPVVETSKLLADRVHGKMKGKKVHDVLNRLHLAVPAKRDEKVRPPFIPEGTRIGRKTVEVDAPKREGDGDDYILDLQSMYLDIDIHHCLMNKEEKYDVIPEIWEGHNFSDYIDPKIIKVSGDLEKEEELKEKAGEYETGEDEEMQEIRQLAKQIREKRKLKIVCSKDKDVHCPRLPRTVKKVMLKETLEKEMGDLGLDMTGKDDVRFHYVVNARRSWSVGVAKKRKREASIAPTSRTRSQIVRVGDERQSGMAKKAKKLMKSQQKDMNCQGKKGEADRHVFDLMPKPIFLWQENVRNKRSQIKALIDEVDLFSV